MLTVLVRLTAETGSTEEPSAAIAEDVIWAAAETRDRIEHLTVVVESGLISVIAFVLADTKEQAVVQVCRLFRRALSRARPLRGWSLTECSATDL